MSKSSPVDILIIGGGPTGLMLACELSLYPGISFRIIDKNSACTTQSRALIIHARSLEAFGQLSLAEKAISQGTFLDALKLFVQGRCTFQMDLTRFRTEQQILFTRYPYVLLIEQSATEQLLEEFLSEHKIKVEREAEAIDLETTNDGTVQVTLSTGEIIRAKYLCGCDGARSIVRHKLNLSFSGRTYSESLFVADCEIDHSPIGKTEAAFFLQSSGLLGMFPMVSNRYRLIGTIHEEKQKEVHVTVDNIEGMLKARSEHFEMNINKCNWLSSYRSHHRHIKTFRYRNRYFLLGDAAHIHSPIGGQGMNTGLQDAHNLAWKLAYKLIHSAHDRLLDTYHDERSLVAETLVNTTDRAFGFMTSYHWFIVFCRLYVMPYVLRFFVQPIFNYSRVLRHAMFRRLSQLGITYRSSTIYDYGASAGHFHRNTPLPGDRFPYVIFDPCHYHLIIFERQSSIKLNEFIEFINKEYSKMIKIHDSHEEKILFECEGVILIRPDGYIAYRTTVFDIKHFQCYFEQFFR